MHLVSVALPVAYVPARVTRGALVAHSQSFQPPRCKTSQYRRTFVWDWGGGGLRAEPMLSLLAYSAFFLSPTIFSFSFFHGLVVWGWGLRIDSVLTL